MQRQGSRRFKFRVTAQTHVFFPLPDITGEYFRNRHAELGIRNHSFVLQCIVSVEFENHLTWCGRLCVAKKRRYHLELNAPVDLLFNDYGDPLSDSFWERSPDFCWWLLRPIRLWRRSRC